MKHSDSMYSLDNDPFRKPRKRKSPGLGKWALVIILGSLFVYRSTRPVMRLRAEPPQAFYKYNLSWKKIERQQERRLALAYWLVAVRRIQTHYSADKPLPADPPPQFQISEVAGGFKSNIIGSRVRYWHQLREVWRQRDTWVVSYRWNTDWVENSLSSLQRNLPLWISKSIQSVSG